MPVHDDGVLVWLQLEGADPAGRVDTGRAFHTAGPILADRPSGGIAAVIRRQARCEPVDVIANRLDPWHGAHFHPYAFASLAVVDGGFAEDGSIELDVRYRLAGRLSIPVRARFSSPEPRTIVMTIIDGEGTGSVVETHATPILPADAPGGPLTAIVEATIATSDRAGFAHVRRLAPVVRPLINAMAGRLWRDDAAYAERRYQLRAVGWRPGE